MKKYVAPLFLGLIFSACSHNQSDDGHHHDMAASDSTTHIHGSSNGMNVGSIELNNGEKWKVNDEMKPFVADAEKILEEYVATHDANYKNLAIQLKEKNSGLINSCTMEGESHNQLHKWLHPNMEMVEALGVAVTKESADTIVNKIQKSYQTYHSCFQ